MTFEEILWRLRNEPEWVILIGLVLLLLVGGGGFYLYYQYGGTGNAQSEFLTATNQYFSATRSGNYDRALRQLQRINERYAGYNFQDKVVFYLGKSYFESGQYAESIRQFRRLVNEYPDSSFRPAAFLHIAYAQQRRGEPDRALGALDQLLETKDHALRPEALFQQARIHQRKGDTSAAREILASISDRFDTGSYWVEQARMARFQTVR